MLGRKHPHSCGEDPRWLKSMRAPLETPPLVWGRRTAARRVHGGGGNTPTRVGKTTDQPVEHLLHQKHPHSCGEDRTHRPGFPMRRETPPLVWGRLRFRQAYSAGFRNTPTRVGKTHPCRLFQKSAEKHPHSCGEDLLRSRWADLFEETPPLVWGRPSDLRRHRHRGRNTPTRVGKTY